MLVVILGVMLFLLVALAALANVLPLIYTIILGDKDYLPGDLLDGIPCDKEELLRRPEPPPKAWRTTRIRWRQPPPRNKLNT